MSALEEIGTLLEQAFGVGGVPLQLVKFVIVLVQGIEPGGRLSQDARGQLQHEIYLYGHGEA